MRTLRERCSGVDPRRMRSDQWDRLRRFVTGPVARFSPFYRRKFREWGVDPRDLRTPADWAELPFTTKADLLATPQSPRQSREFVLQPDPAELRRDPRVLWRAMRRGREAVRLELEREYRPVFLTSTTGRSAEPVPFLYSGHDLDRLTRAGRDLCEVQQCQPDYRIANLFPYAPHLGFWQVHYAMTGFNVFGLSTGGGKTLGTEGNLRLLEKMDPDVIVGMPTFVYHLLSQAVEEGRRLSRLDHLVLGGEKVPDGMRRRLAELVNRVGAGDVRVMAVYGFTEAKMAFGECPGATDQATGYHVPPEYAYLEIIDPATGAVQPDGKPGEIVLTPIDARGSVVLRYRTGDVIDGGLVHGPCPHCGLNVPRLVGNIGRRSEVRELRIDKVKGTLVDFNTLEVLLDGLPELESWQVVLAKRNDDPLELDTLAVHACARGGVEPDALAGRIRSLFQERLEISPNSVTFHTRAELGALQGLGRELKERRLVDRRPK